MKVWEALSELEQRGPADIDVGICYNVLKVMRRRTNRSFQERVWFDNRVACWEAWPKYSGDSSYPVPSHTNRWNAEQVFDRVDALDMWNLEHPYGATRHELLAHCIKWFKEKDL